MRLYRDRMRINHPQTAGRGDKAGVLQNPKQLCHAERSEASRFCAAQGCAQTCPELVEGVTSARYRCHAERSEASRLFAPQGCAQTCPELVEGVTITL